jgi:hypothetical protein
MDSKIIIAGSTYALRGFGMTMGPAGMMTWPI